MVNNNLFKSATEAFESAYPYINAYGRFFAGTKAIFNSSFTLLNPMDNVITTSKRKFSKDYADFEFEWYLKGDRDAFEISERAKIWKNMMIPRTTNVVSNYGYFWNKNNQLDRMIDELKTNPSSRRAILVHYDINELDLYKYDTPCNIALSFYMEDDRINLSVFARSIDLWYGFGNDQYCFSKLMNIVAERLNCRIGIMHWSVVNFHIYEKHFNKF